MICIEPKKAQQMIDVLDYFFFKSPKNVLGDFITHLELELNEQFASMGNKKLKIAFLDKDIRKTIEALRYLTQKETSPELEMFISDLEQIFEDQRMMTREETNEMVKWCLEHVK